MLSDIEIAQAATLLPIKEVAAQIGIKEDELEFYGKYKAKLSDELANRLENEPDGNLFLLQLSIQPPQVRAKQLLLQVLVRLWLRLVKRL